MSVPQSDYLDGLMRECQELKAELAESTAREAALQEALKVAHHELTQLHGVFASDAGPDGLNRWQVDCKAALKKIGAALSATSSVTAKEPQ